MLSFADVISPLSSAEVEAQLLNYLQGIGLVVQLGLGTSPALGTGNLEPTGPALAAFNCVVVIDATGQLGDGICEFSYSIDGGLTFPLSQSGIAMPASGQYQIPNTGVTLVFSNGEYNVSTSFIAGESYVFPVNVPSYPVSTWEALDTGPTLVELEANAIADLSGLVAAIAAGGNTGTATGGFADLLGQGFYNLNRNLGVQTVAVFELSCAASAGPYTIETGELTAALNANGLTLTNLDGGTLASGGTLTLAFQASAVGALYNPVTDTGSGSAVSLVTALPGVTIDNPVLATVGSASNAHPIQVNHAGTGSGAISLSGDATGAFSVVLEIQTGDLAAAATFTYSVNGNAAQGPVSAASPWSYAGVVTTFGSGTFVAGDFYFFSTDCKTTVGVNVEGDAAYMSRCQQRWPSLANNEPAGKYVAWALAASQEVGEVSVNPDFTVPGQVDVTVATSIGDPVSSSALQDVASFILPRLPNCVGLFVNNAVQEDLTIAGTVYASPSAIAKLQGVGGNPGLYSVQFEQLQATIGIGGLAQFFKQVVGTLTSVGALLTKLEGVTLNGGTADIQLAGGQTPNFVLDLTYVPTSS
jgi:hypothetical protein